MSQQEIQELELSIEEAKKIADRGEMAVRLAEHPDFKTLVMQGFFVDDAARLVHLLSDPMTSPADKEHIQNAILGIGYLKRYLHGIVQMGINAEKSLYEDRETLEEIRSEELLQGAEVFADDGD